MKGLAIPVQVTPNGRTRTVEGNENDKKIVSAALGDATNENPFMQDIALGPGITFEINDMVARPVVRTKIRKVFEKFEQLKRYRLIEDSIRWLGPDDGLEEGDLVCEFDFVSLEANDPLPQTLQFAAPKG